jgi:ribose transport system permease protein
MTINSENVLAPGLDGRARNRFGGKIANFAPFATLSTLLVFFAIASPSFASLDNPTNILTEISVTGITAVGLTFVILCAEIDLSVASVANATGIILAFFTAQDASVNTANIPLWGGFAIAVALGGCVVLGVVNAIGVTRIGVTSFIMMLAMLQIASGIGALLIRGKIAYAVPPLVSTLGSKSIGPLPWIVILAATVLLLGHLTLRYTRFGRYVYMVGGNREAAEYSGVNVRAVISSVMVISAVCSGIAGISVLTGTLPWKLAYRVDRRTQTTLPGRY